MKKSRISEKSYYLVYQGDIVAAFAQNSIDRYVILNSQLAAIYVPLDFDEVRLNNIFEVAWWSESLPMSSLIEITNNLENGETVTNAAGTEYVYNNPYINVNGSGVLIAVIDSGVDYLHPDLRNEDGSSKIVSLWDQESDVNTPPEGMIFGSEFSREELNQAISENNASLSVDTIGTGTMVSGILVGSGNVNPLYKGVALGAELIVVKLRTYEGTYYEGKINYTISDFLAAITYVLDVAEREDKPIIINLTVGTMSGAVAKTTILDTYLKLSQRGVVVVGGAGNQGNTDIHYSGRFTSMNEVQDIIIQDAEDHSLDIVLNTQGPDKIKAMIISPSGEESYEVGYAPDYYVYRGRFNLENTTYSMRFIYPWIASGKEQLEIKLRDIKPGIWTLRLIPEFLINGGYDIYLPNKNLIAQNTRFIDPDSVATITRYGAGEGVITVGAYNDQTDSMWIGSSKGPIRDSTIKPDIAAPGVDIISTYPISTYNTATGTGVSASIVSGVLALIVEYLNYQTELSSLSLFTEILKTYLMLGATKKEIYTYPNITQGYGVLNLKDTIQQIANNL